MKKKDYALIDLFKLIFAVMVVIIHTRLYYGSSDAFVWYLSALCTRLAVPFFIITSIFFLGIKVQEKGFTAFREYRKALWPKLLFWGGLSTVLYAFVLYKESTDYLKTTVSIVQQTLFYPKGSMWFILALIVGSYILEFLLKKKIPKMIIGIISLILFSFALLCNTYYFIAKPTVLNNVVKQYLRLFISARNGLFLFIYIFIGYYISSSKLINLGKKALVPFTLLGYGLLIFESKRLFGVETLDDTSLYISYLVFIPAFMLLLIKCDSSILHHRDMRALSGVLYYTHPFFNLLLADYLGIKFGIMRFVIVLSMSVIVWIVTRRSKNPFIKKILY